MSITYARFNDLTGARIASRQLRRRVGSAGRVEVLNHPRRLSHHLIPVRMTSVRAGALAGGLVVGFVTTISVIGALQLMNHRESVLALGETLAVCVGLSILFGGLAGALSFASDNGLGCRKIRAWLSHGDSVVMVDSPRGHEDTLRVLGGRDVGRI